MSLSRIIQPKAILRRLIRYTIREEILTTGVLSDLSIKKLERTDSALFTCVATNAFGSDDTSINLIVQGIPLDLLLSSSNVSFSSNIDHCQYLMNAFLFLLYAGLDASLDAFRFSCFWCPPLSDGQWIKKWNRIMESKLDELEFGNATCDWDLNITILPQHSLPCVGWT